MSYRDDLHAAYAQIGTLEGQLFRAREKLSERPQVIIKEPSSYERHVTLIAAITSCIAFILGIPVGVSLMGCSSGEPRELAPPHRAPITIGGDAALPLGDVSRLTFTTTEPAIVEISTKTITGETLAKNHNIKLSLRSGNSYNREIHAPNAYILKELEPGRYTIGARHHGPGDNSEVVRIKIRAFREIE
jgi:hypothetical protein